MAIVRTMLLGLLLVGPALLGAAEGYEGENHFQIVIKLIDRGLRQPAMRQITAFEEAGYGSASAYIKGLRFWYAKRFRTLSPSEDERKQLTTVYKDLETELKGMAGKLPPGVKALLENDTGPVDELANQILNRINPDAPPPTMMPAESERREIIGLIQALLESADEQLAAAMAEVKAEGDAEMPPEDTPEGQKVLQERTFRRYKFANIFYTVYKVAREVILHGETYGIDKLAGSENFQRWMHTRLLKCVADLGDWEWIYAPYYPFLRHRLSMMNSEIVLLNEQRPDMGKITGNDTGYTDVKDGLVEVTSIDTSVYKNDPETVLAVELLKLQAWADLLQWHLMLGDNRYYKTGLDLFEGDFLNRGYALTDKNKAMEAAVGHVYLVAQQLYHVAKNSPKRDELLAKLGGSKNYFAGNASLWTIYYREIGGSQGNNYERPPVAVTPDLGMNMARQAWRASVDEVDDVKALSLRMQAITTMRNALKGLSEPGTPEFLALGPELYLFYSNYLYKMGWYHQAAVVARDGVGRFKPAWDRKAFVNREGALNEAGERVKSLANNFLHYAMKIRTRDSGASVNNLYSEAVTYLQDIDPDSAGGNLKRNVIILTIKNGDFEQAMCLLEDYIKEFPKEEVWVLGTMALVRFKQYQLAVKNSGKDSNGAKQALEVVIKTIERPWGMVDAVINGGKTAPKGQEDEYKVQYKNLLAIKVSIIFLQGDTAQVLQLLNPKFWEEIPTDESICLDLLRNMANAAYLVLKQAKDDNRLQDPAYFLECWKNYVYVKETFDKVLAARPSLISDTDDHRNALGNVFWNARKQATFFRESCEAGRDEMKTYEAATFAAIEDQAMANYADVMDPIMDVNADPKVVISVADALWKLDRRDRAATHYETYKLTLDKNPEIKHFHRDPVGYLQKCAEIIGGRSELDAFWKGRGCILELLTDQKDFIDNIYAVGRPKTEWTEEKADYGAAWTKVQELRAVVERLGSRVERKDQVMDTLTKLEDLVLGLVSTLRVNGRLVEVYRDRGGEDLNKAIALSLELYAYNPRSPLYRSLAIEATILAIKSPPFPTDEEVRKAQMMAILQRNDTKPHVSLAKEYWMAVCQIMEFAIYLKDTGDVDKTLSNNLQLDKCPAYDLSIRDGLIAAGVKPFMRAKDKVAEEICQRYLALFELDGVSLTPPYRIDKGPDGAVYFLVGDQTLEAAEAARAEAIKRAQEDAKKAPQEAAGEGATPPAEGEVPPPVEGETPPPADAATEPEVVPTATVPTEGE